jgi:alpha-1,2-mannosyltransferase
MTSEPGATAARGSSMRRAFGLRLFFDPRSRERLFIFAAVISVLGFAGRAAVQVAGLGQASLQYDYKPYFDAGLSLNRGGDPYAAFLNACGTTWCHVGYIYPPLLAEVFRPLALLPPHSGALAWLLLTYAFFAAAVVVADRTVREWLSPTSRALMLLAAMVFLPVYKNFYFLQVNTLMLLVLAAAAWVFTRKRDAATGALLGLATVLRVTPFVMAPMLLRSRADLRRPAGIAGLVLGVVVIMAALAVLTSTTFEYVTTVLPRLGQSTDTLDNISLPGLLLRAGVAISTGAPNLTVIKLVSVFLQLTLLGLTWVFSLGLEGGRPRAAVFAAFLAVTPIISSITWDHHLVTELLALALLAPSLRPRSRPFWLALLSYPLLWVPRGVTDGIVAALGLSFPHGLATLPFLVVTSLNLVGMLLLWLTCLGALRGYRSAVAVASTR